MLVSKKYAIEKPHSYRELDSEEIEYNDGGLSKGWIGVLAATAVCIISCVGIYKIVGCLSRDMDAVLMNNAKNDAIAKMEKLADDVYGKLPAGNVSIGTYPNQRVVGLLYSKRDAFGNEIGIWDFQKY